MSVGPVSSRSARPNSRRPSRGRCENTHPLSRGPAAERPAGIPACCSCPCAADSSRCAQRSWRQPGPRHRCAAWSFARRGRARPRSAGYTGNSHCKRGRLPHSLPPSHRCPARYVRRRGLTRRLAETALLAGNRASRDRGRAPPCPRSGSRNAQQSHGTQDGIPASQPIRQAHPTPPAPTRGARSAPDRPHKPGRCALPLR